MSLPMHSGNRFPETRLESADPFAMQLALSRVHARLVPMRRVAGEYEIHPGAEAWFELPAGRGLAGYGLGRALRMLLDVLRGLTALHDTFAASGVPFAHGEVTLSQFRVDPEGVCRLVPLTARHSSEGGGTLDPAVIGHLAPERLLGETLDARADVFSAGILLWEALAGRRLFEETTADAIVDRLMAEKLQMPKLPPELAWAIPLKSVAARALAVDPHQRFSDCAELATAIAIVARERVATHAEIANFFGAPARSIERRARDSVRPSAEESSMTPALLVPSSGPRSQRGESSVVTSAARERAVPSESQTFSAVGAPSSRRAKRSTLAPLGSSSTRPSRPPTRPSSPPDTADVEAGTQAASDPSFTPEPRALRPSSMPRGAQRSPFSALLMPPLDPLPKIAGELELETGPASRTEDTTQFKATELAGALSLEAARGLQDASPAKSQAGEPLDPASSQKPIGIAVSELAAPSVREPAGAEPDAAPNSASDAPRLSTAPRSSRLPPPLPAYAQVPSFPSTSPESAPSSKSTFSAVVAPMSAAVERGPVARVDQGLPRHTSGRKLWTVLAIASVTAALAVAALTHGSSSPSSAPTITLAAAQPARALASVAPSDHSRRPLPPAASAAPAAAAGGSSPASTGSGKASDTHSSPHSGKSSGPNKARPGEKDYGI